MSQKGSLIIRQLGLTDYEPIWRAMQSFTSTRQEHAPDELWVLSHRPVFTQGQAGKAEHVLAPGDIPVVQIDRGGQVTYHGPGQLVVYLLIDVRRAGIGVRELVSMIELAIIEALSAVKIEAGLKAGAPGVYVGESKIASLGLRIRRGCSYHGMSLNVAMDLEPFTRINPCGYQGLAVTQVIDLAPEKAPGNTPELLMETMEKLVLQHLMMQLGPYSWIDVRQEL
ncbi:MAG: lipoyl(octanoyl) transferase LipB [Pseudohongiella sp.]|nr:lipoyl(octanoyl) transferase LipB [Pseudohongiella sp.]MDO9518642.1 lipoyl(octanoyl) transferase LipB [Pseudohongiella sp.]MDP2128415.1 lipoyl(octanoyl) transferase LipB [Pseudohongiella sp.]